MNVAGGWTSGEVFTIPGSAIGYYDGDFDLKFGTNVSETVSTKGDGVASITVTNLGSGIQLLSKIFKRKVCNIKTNQRCIEEVWNDILWICSINR